MFVVGLPGERQVLRDAIQIRLMNGGRPAKSAATLPAFGLIEVTPPRVSTQRLPSRRYLETFGDGFLRFDAFGTTHNS